MGLEPQKGWGSAIIFPQRLKTGTLLRFDKAHHKISHRRKSERCSGLEELPQILGFPFNICATAEAINFKFGMPLGFAKAERKTTPRGKSGRGLGLRKLPNIWNSPFIFCNGRAVLLPLVGLLVNISDYFTLQSSSSCSAATRGNPL